MENEEKSTGIMDIAEVEGMNTVNARDLYDFLGVKAKFSDWIVQRIEKYAFKENIDFIEVKESRSENSDQLFKGNVVKASTNKYNKQMRSFYLTIDMAKELSMLTNNDKGKEARQYFISIEKKYKERQGVDHLSADLSEEISSLVEEKLTALNTAFDSKMNDVMACTIANTITAMGMLPKANKEAKETGFIFPGNMSMFATDESIDSSIPSYVAGLTVKEKRSILSKVIRKYGKGKEGYRELYAAFLQKYDIDLYALNNKHNIDNDENLRIIQYATKFGHIDNLFQVMRTTFPVETLVVLRPMVEAFNNEFE